MASSKSFLPSKLLGSLAGLLSALCLVMAFLAFTPLASAAPIEVYGGGGGGGGGGGTTTGMGGNRGLGGAGGSGGGSALGGFAGGDGSAFDGGIGGGGGGGGGTAGAGQSAIVDIGGSAGAGGNATNGGNSIGGNGGAGGNGSIGTAGSDTNASAIADSISIIAGNGGNGGQSIWMAGNTGAGGNGGAGGAANLTLTGATVTSTGAVLVQSGAAGQAGNGNGPTNGAGGAGGTASLTANALIAPGIFLIKQDGALTFDINTLDITTGDTLLTTINTLPGDVQIGTANLANGRWLMIDNTLGDFVLGTINVTGVGNLMVLNGSPPAIGSLNAQNATLGLFAPTSTVAGSTLVTATTATLTGAMLTLNTQGPLPLNPGESITLIATLSGLSAPTLPLMLQTSHGQRFEIRQSGNQLIAVLLGASSTAAIPALDGRALLVLALLIGVAGLAVRRYRG